MKRILYILLCLLGIGCSDFLEYKDNDKIIPRELKHFDELVLGELIKKTTGSEMMALDFMTDDIESVVNPLDGSTSRRETRGEYFSYYTWAKNNQLDMQQRENNDGNWASFYNKILMCNILEHDVSEFEEDHDRVRTRLLGEIAFMRALSYYYLVNMYGEPYKDKEQAKIALGVPINKAISVEKNIYKRAKLQEIYDLIEGNLLNSIDLLKVGDQANSIFRPNVNVAQLFLSRIYLQQKRWQDAKDIASVVISESGASIENLENMSNYIANKINLYNISNKSILFSWGKRNRTPLSLSYSEAGHWEVSQSLREMYVNEETKKDVRGTAFFDEYKPFYPKKFDSNKKVCYDWCYRIEEAYLNRAEACIELGGTDNLEQAMQDINIIRRNRIEGDYQKITMDADEARKILRDEKRMEFCFEDCRWFDIRRWEIEIRHKFHELNEPLAGNTYVLAPGSPNYILSLPLEVQKINFEIENFERVETIVNE